jgi:hypothetical protein
MSSLGPFEACQPRFVVNPDTDLQSVLPTALPSAPQQSTLDRL